MSQIVYQGDMVTTRLLDTTDGRIERLHNERRDEADSSAKGEELTTEKVKTRKTTSVVPRLYV